MGEHDYDVCQRSPSSSMYESEYTHGLWVPVVFCVFLFYLFISTSLSVDTVFFQL